MLTAPWRTVTLPQLVHAGRYRSADPSCSLHAHAAFELLAIRGGRCRVEIEGHAAIPAGPGDVFLIPPKRTHIHRNQGEVTTSYLVFSLPSRLLPPVMRHLTVAADDPMRGWIEQAIAIHLSLEKSDARAAGGLLLSILARLDRLAPPAALRVESAPLARAEKHLLAHLAGPVAMDDLCRASGVGARHLRDLFVDHHGCPPARWHRDRRLELAQRLLGDHYLTVKQVAAACGWDDANLFGRTFKARYGTSPGDWRSAPAAG
jgi:AraC-like DNA-binding protein